MDTDRAFMTAPCTIECVTSDLFVNLPAGLTVRQAETQCRAISLQYPYECFVVRHATGLALVGYGNGSLFVAAGY